MSDSVLTVLKFCLLAVLYLFLAARGLDRRARAARHAGAGAALRPSRPRPRRAARRATRKHAGGWSSWSPPPSAGAAYPVDGEVTLGRGGGCAVPLAFDTFVSQVHARAFDRDGNALGRRRRVDATARSSNGKRIARTDASCAKGIAVQVGETVLEVER